MSLEIQQSVNGGGKTCLEVWTECSAGLEMRSSESREDLMVQSLIELASSYADLYVHIYTVSFRSVQCNCVRFRQVLIRVSAGEQTFLRTLEDEQVGLQLFADLENSRCHSAPILRLMHAP